MADVRLTHPDRDTLDFPQRQESEHSTEAVANIANELGVDRPSLVNTESREVERQIRGTVTGPRRARVSSSTDDWMQALADYVDTLEAHVNEFQGTGYTLVDDIRDFTGNAVLESVEWSVTPGAPFEFDYSANLKLGRGTFSSDPISRRNPAVNDAMNVMLRVDGIDLPGMRDYSVSKSIGVDVRANFGRSDTDNNDVVIDEGVQQSISFEGTHTGTAEERAAAFDTLDQLAVTKEPVTLETRFPGYTLEGFIVEYTSSQEQRFGTDLEHYTLEFVEGTRA